MTPLLPPSARPRALAALLLAALLLAGAADARAQAQTGLFARMGFGARGIALGNALAADGSGDASPYYNPALAPYAAGQTLEASTALMTFDRELQFLQFATPLRPRAGIAAGLVHAGVSNIDGRDDSGFHTEDLTTDEFAFFLAFGLKVGQRASVGLGLQLFRTDLYDALSAVNSVGIDAGLTVQATDALRLGLVVDDLLARYAYDTSGLFGDGGKTTTDHFPTRVRLGAGYTLLEGRLQVLAEVENRFTAAEARTRRIAVVGDVPREVTETEELTVHDARFRLGGEYRLSDVFAVRAGLDGVGADGLTGTKPTAGFMVEQPVGQLVLRAEYALALEPYTTDPMHLIALRVGL